MPYPRQTLSQLVATGIADMQAALPGTDPLLRFSSLNILVKILAGMTNLQLAYLDFIALQAVPFTSTGEFLAAWGAMKGVYLQAAKSASGTATFSDTSGAGIDAGAIIVRGDGVEATVTANATPSGSSITVEATVNADPTGQTGAFGNSQAGTIWTLGAAVAGIGSNSTSSTAFQGGVDLETQASFLTRILEAYQLGPEIGKDGDYVKWARDSSPAVTRAWCNPNGMGSGTVVVFFMEDVVEAAYGGFPQGTNGVAAKETRDTAATGDQLALANYIYTIQTNTALVYACAPNNSPQNFVITGIGTPSTATQQAIEAAIAGVFQQYASPLPSDGPVNLDEIEEAIGAVPGTEGFVIASINGSTPGNITTALGYLATLGTVTY